MRHAILAGLIAVLLAAPAAAQDQAQDKDELKAKAPDASAAYYRAFYLETANRDFAAAVKEYEGAEKLARAASRHELVVKAIVGRARCLRALGDLMGARAAARAALKVAPEDAEASVLLGSLTKSEGADEELAARLRGMIEGLSSGRNNNQTERDIMIAGVRAVPFLAEALRSQNVRTASGAARVLAKMDRDEARAALVAAFGDSQVGFERALVEALKFLPPKASSLAVFEAALKVESGGLRAEVVGTLRARAAMLVRTAGGATALKGLLGRIAGDPDRAVHELLESSSWPQPVMAALVPAVLGGLRSEDPVVRAKALQTVRVNHGLELLVTEDLLRVLEEDPSEELRAAAVACLLTELRSRKKLNEMPEAVARRAVRRALRDERHAVVKEVPSTASTLVDDEAGGEAYLAALRRAFAAEDHRIWWRSLGGLFHGLSPEFRQGRSQDLLEAVVPGLAPEREPDRNWRWSLLYTVSRTLLRRQRPQDPVPAVAAALGVLPDAASRALWVRRFGGFRVPSPEAFAKAVASPDPEVRIEAYAALRQQARFAKDVRLDPDLVRTDLTDGGTYLRKEFGGKNAKPMRDELLGLLAAAPDRRLAPLLEELWRESDVHHVHAMARDALVAALGKDAVPFVRADLGKPNHAYHARRNLIALLDADVVPDLLAYAAEKGMTNALGGLWSWNQWKDADGKLQRKKTANLSPALTERFLAEVPEELIDATVIELMVDKASGEQRRRVLLAGLKSEAASTVRAAAEEAGRYNLLEAWPLLVDLLDRPQVEIRQAAKEALEEIRSYRDLKASFERFDRKEREAAFGEAKALLGDADPVKRRGAAYALGALGDPSAVPLLLKLLADEDAQVREAAMAALSRLGG